MSLKKTIIGIVLSCSLVLSSQALAEWKGSVTAFWGASGAAYCNNHDNIPIWVGMSYTHHNEALTALWAQAVTVCQDKGGVYDASGSTYSQWGPYW